MITPEVDTYIKYICQKERGVNSVVYNRKQYLRSVSDPIGNNSTVASVINQNENVVCVLITDISMIVPSNLGNFYLVDNFANDDYRWILTFAGNVNNQNMYYRDINYIALGENFSFSTTDSTAIFTVGFITVSKGNP
jgi:hypothetical protein